MRQISPLTLRFKIGGTGLAAVLLVGAGVVHAAEVPSTSEETQKTVSRKPVKIDDPLPTGFSSWGDVIEVQNQLNDAADKIRSLHSSVNLSSITLAHSKKRLDVYWKGNVPSDVADIAKRMPTGYSIRFHSAPYSVTELTDAATDAVLLLRKSGMHASARPRTDASGLEVGVSGDLEAAKTQLTGFRLPVHVERGPTFRLTYGRLSDNSPWWGGAAWYATNGPQSPAFRCTSAFAINLPKFVNQKGGTRMLTAGHCADDGLETFTKSAPDSVTFDHMGWTERDLLPYNEASTPHPDLMVINTDPTISGGFVYKGSGDPATDVGMEVKKATSVNVGNFVCTNGAKSLKLKCTGQVIGVDSVETSDEFPYYVITHVAVAQAIDSKTLVKKGDSGGPVVFPYGNGFAAQGVTSLSAAIPDPDGEQGPVQGGEAGSMVGFIPIQDALELYNATIVTPPAP
ncbi:chymotrypsin family serine protease [Streptomyces chartreusis]|uniref:hypothetical protein n=1 Tax=Streptomyces chartreusis TaxID=1969 RepID=UPI0036BFA7E1